MMSALESIRCRDDVTLRARALRRQRACDEGPNPRRGDDPGPEGPEAEPVGGEDEDGGDAANVENMPSPGPGQPIVPEHGCPDADAS
ncbi:MAG: hypothetical protein BGO98_20335 [Myxococcales bacterium 68-20]|nr:MAG: hypothetical protein BGO98_20335 [Myxococcales bacterium 68-20]